MKLTQQDKSLIKLFRELPLEQCKQLYLQQRDSLKNHWLRVFLRSIIGAKTIYGDASYMEKKEAADAKK